MSTTDTHTDPTAAGSSAAIAFKLEVVVIPVADVDRAKAFYCRLGWRLDADFARDGGFRIVQLNPPGSAASIQFGTQVSTAAPGSAESLYLVVDDIEAAHADLVARGVEVSELFHLGPDGPISGPDPERRSYFTRATFADPDGNTWLLQEITQRLPGRGDAAAPSHAEAAA